jgi:hypothetical protein
LPAAAESIQQLPATTESCAQLPATSESYQQLPKKTESCEQLPVRTIANQPPSWEIFEQLPAVPTVSSKPQNRAPLPLSATGHLHYNR